MKGRTIILWTLLACCFALAVTVWPATAYLDEREADARKVEELDKRAASLGEEQLKKYRNLAKWYNHQLELGIPGFRGFYSSVLDLGEGMMGVLDVPELKLRLPISHGLGSKVGHDPNSKLPIGGRGNHTVLILVKNYAWRVGQTVYIDILDQRLAYRVESVQVMPAGWSSERPDAAGQDLLTLVLDRKNTRTIIRCVRCANLTVRQQHVPQPGRIMLAGVMPLAVLSAALAGRRRYAKREHTPRICGFHRKKPEKSDLF